MTENRSNYKGASGEKQVITGSFDGDFLEDSWNIKLPKVNVPRGGTAHETVQTEKQAEGDSKLAEAARLFREKQWEEALAELLRIQQDASIQGEGLSDEEQQELAYYLGLCYTKLKRFNDASPHLERFIIGAGGDPMREYQCRMTLAYIYIMTDRAAMAETELERLRAKGLESVMLYNTLAYAAYAQKHYIGAIELYEKALDMDDDNPTALNSLGYILADTGLDKIKGLRLCRKAVEKNSQNAAYVDSLGWACYKCGKPAEARDWLQKARDMAPEEKEIQNHYRTVARGVM